MTTSTTETVCPGCGLSMPAGPPGQVPPYDGYYNTSSECWAVCTEVLGEEFGNPVIFGQVHQLTVDSYAVQHAGGRHPDKSIGIHLVGLHLVLERGLPPTRVPPVLQAMAKVIDTWPHFAPPEAPRTITVCDVALADSPADHAAAVRRWAETVWAAWGEHHDAVSRLVTQTLDLDEPE